MNSRVGNVQEKMVDSVGVKQNWLKVALACTALTLLSASPSLAQTPSAPVAPSAQAKSDAPVVISPQKRVPRAQDPMWAKAKNPITWDERSLFVNGKRLMIWSGEFHPYRLPSPDLWRDVLEKVKANGFNGIAYYVGWGYHSPKQGVYDFTGIRDLNRALKEAQAAGLYVIIRPGPYMNAEVTRGGYPGWMVNQRARARTDAPDYVAASDEWFAAVNKVIAANQFTDGGGPVVLYQIENELLETQPQQSRYMYHLYKRARADGITVPIFHNDIGRNGYWVPEESTVPLVVHGPTDLYAWDTYPGGVCNVDATTGKPNNAPDFGWYGAGGAKGGSTASPTTPGFTAEFGGGWFDYWGSNGTYDCTAERKGGGYQRIFYGTNIANGLTIQNFYMLFGGTSWGWLPAPVVYTSYDYGAAIDERRGQRSKLLVMRQMGQFVNTANETLAGMAKGAPLTASNKAIKLYRNANPDNGAQLIVAMHNPSGATTRDSFHFDLTLKDGSVRVPSVGDITIDGQDSRLLLADYTFGTQSLAYSTSELQTQLPHAGGDLALLHGRMGEPGETVLRYVSAPKVKVLAGKVAHEWDAARGHLKLSYTHEGLSRVEISGGGRGKLQLLLAETGVAQGFFRPNDKTLVRGPWLVRGAQLTGSTLALRGDTQAPAPLEVWTSDEAKALSWNGASVALGKGVGGSLMAKADLAGPAEISLPSLPSLSWIASPLSPETQPAFDDSKWRETNASGTASTTRGAPGLPILTAADYGFHHGDVWYRGRYQARVGHNQLEFHYGAGGSGLIQVWVDGKYLGQDETPSGQARPQTLGTVRFTLPDWALTPGEHVISVMVRNNGHNWNLLADDAHKEGRGLITASLSTRSGPNFVVPIAWKIQGNQGGEDLVDPVRGPYNAGGLYGERKGWHLQDTDVSNWTPTQPANPPAGAGTYWLRTRFALNTPKDHDVQLGLAFGDTSKPRSDREYRVLIFVNGWNMGQFIAHVGPQRVFVLPPGILNMQGDNTLALAVTSDGAPGNALEEVRLVNLRTARGGVPVSPVAAPTRLPVQP